MIDALTGEDFRLDDAYLTRVAELHGRAAGVEGGMPVRSRSLLEGVGVCDEAIENL